MTVKNFTHSFTISDYASLFERMVELGFIKTPDYQVENFIQDITVGENHYSNGVVEFKIFRSSYGKDTFVNFRNFDHPHMDFLGESAWPKTH